MPSSSQPIVLIFFLQLSPSPYQRLHQHSTIRSGVQFPTGAWQDPEHIIVQGRHIRFAPRQLFAMGRTSN
jgi:hypothetical protein